MASLPSYASVLLAGFGEERASALRRTEMESGPPKQAKVMSRVMVSRRAVIRLASKADYLLFKTWFASTINQGADWFDWSDPVSGTTVSARIAGGALGQAVPIGNVAGGWLIPVTLETWSA